MRTTKPSLSTYHLRDIVRGCIFFGLLAIAVIIGSTSHTRVGAQAPTTLGAAAAALQPGHYTTLTTTGLTAGLLDPESNGGTTIEWADSGAWDPVNRTFSYIGKKAGCSSPWRNVIYTESTNSWAIGTSPVATGCGHGYDGNTADPVTGTHFFKPYDSNVVYKFTGSSWTSLTPLLPDHNIAGIAKSPTGLLYSDQAWDAFFSDATGLKTQVSVGSGSYIGTYHSITEYNPVHDVFLAGGGNDLPRSVARIQIVNGSPVRTRLSDAPISFGAGEGGNGVEKGVVTVDPVSGDYIIFNKSTGQFYSFNIMANAWQLIGTAGDGNMPPLPTYGGGTIRAAISAPINTHGVIMYLAQSGSQVQVYLYKHSASTPPPPDTTVPSVSVTAPTAGATVTGTINLTASASDNVGVAGVRFTVDGANVGSEDTSSPYGISWSSVGTANGSHAIRAVARDAAGNTTTSSAITVTVSNAPTDPLTSLETGHWYQVPNSHLRSVVPNPLPNWPSGTDPRNIMVAWSGGAYDTARDRLVVWGGGHGDYAGNELYAFDVTSLTWQRLTDPSTDVGGTESTGVYPDGKPRSRHTYESLEYLGPPFDRFCAFGAHGFYPGGQVGSPRLDCFNFDTSLWEQYADTPKYGIDLLSAYDPVNKRAWITTRGSEVEEYNPATNTWSHRGVPGSGDIYYANAEIDPVRRRLIAIGGTFGTAASWNIDAAGTLTRTNLATTGATEIEDQENIGLAYSADCDCLVAWDGGANVYRLNLDTLVWTLITPAQTNTVVPTQPPSQGTYGRFRYVPSKNVFIVVNDIDQDVYFYRLSGTTPPPPTNPLGILTQDGPATPEQISMYLPVTGTLAATTASVRYRLTSGSSWTVAHPLYRIRDADTPATVADALAGVITGLTPGTSYTVEVTTSLGSTSDVQTLVTTTRALPTAAGIPNKTITAGSTSAQIQTVFNGLDPGDVVEFANGTYTIDNLQLNRSGSDSQPIYIRGASRDGVVLKDTTGRVLYFLDASDIVLENLTLEGSSTDSGTASTSEAIRLYDGFTQQQVTVRQVTMRGVDKGVATDNELDQFLMYDCSLVGNNVWDQAFLETNLSWNDDGVRVPGFGNAVFNNTLSGFGDAFAVDDGVASAGIHFFRNEVLFTDDDAFEGDYAYRNITFYDNRIHNSMTLASFDPINGGPAFVFRNIAINTGRSPYKFNDTNSGFFVYNNTVVRTNGYGSGAGWGWNQSNNGALKDWGYRNNLLIYRGSGNLLAMESGSNTPIDFTNNAWYPNGSVWWTNSGGSYTSMALARSGLSTTTSVFSGSTQRHQNDVITVIDPFITDVALGADYLTKVTTVYTPYLSDGTTPRSTGVAIAGVTDGFSGPAPDMGAMITGVTAPTWGDRGAAAPPPPVADTTAPAPVNNLTAS